MTFEEAQAQYANLKHQWEVGQISPEQFVEAVNALQVQADDGSWWQIRGADGAWLRWNETAWEEVNLSSETGQTSNSPIPQKTGRSIPYVWIAIGCFGCIIIALLGGLGVVYSGVLPIPGLSQIFGTEEPAGEITPLPALATEPSDGTTPPTGGDPIPNLQDSPRAVEILGRGVVRIGVHHNGLPPLAFQDGTSYAGFEIDLVKEIVSRVFGDAVTIEFVPVTPTVRFSMVQSGDIDLLIRGVTHTTSREEFGYFTANYFLDGTRLLVFRDSPYFRLTDLTGKSIAVQAGTQMERNLRAGVTATGLEIAVIAVPQIEDAIALLDNGDVEAAAGFWTRMASLTNGNQIYRIVGGLLSTEPYGILVPKDDLLFRDIIDTALNEIISDATWNSYYSIWFEGEVPFSPVELRDTLPIDR